MREGFGFKSGAEEQDRKKETRGRPFSYQRMRNSSSEQRLWGVASTRKSVSDEGGSLTILYKHVLEKWRGREKGKEEGGSSKDPGSWDLFAQFLLWKRALLIGFSAIGSADYCEAVVPTYSPH